MTFLALLAPLLRGCASADPLGRLKTLLRGPALPRAEGMPHVWDIGTLLPGLCQDLPDPLPDLLLPLLAAINDPAQVAALEQFALWRDAPSVAQDAPRPDDGE